MPERNNYLAANCCSHYSRNTNPRCLFPTLEEGTKRDSMTIEHFWGIAGFGFHVSASEASRYAIAPKQRDLVQETFEPSEPADRK